MSDPFAYIDLARQGRTGLKATLFGALRIIGYTVIAMIVIALATLGLIASGTVTGDTMLRFAHGENFPAQLAVMLVGTVALLWSVRDATVKSQRRPFRTLISADPRPDLRRVAAGFAAWIAASVVAYGLVIAASVLFASPTDDTPTIPTMPPLVDLVLGLLLIPLQATAEELVFRGWLTQTLGQAIRNRIAVSAIVAVLFAAVHGVTIGPAGSIGIMIYSLSFSIFTFAEQRLEPAIGAHAAQDLFVLFILQPVTGHDPSIFAAQSHALSWITVPACLAQGLIAYGLLAAVRRYRLRPLASSAPR